MITFTSKIIVLFLLISNHLLQAQTYYIDDSIGNDTNDGLSITTPWKTIAIANATLQAGETVLIREGTYHEMIYPSHSGTENNNITYENYPGEIAEIVGESVDQYVVKIRTAYIVIKGLTLYHIDLPNCLGYSDCWDYQNTIIHIGYSGAHHTEILNNKIISPYPLVYLDTDVYFRETAISLRANTHHNLIQGNEIRNMSKIGIGIGHSPMYTRIIDNTIIDIYQDCIHYGSGNNTITGTLIEGNILAGSIKSDGIQFDSSDGAQGINTINRGTIIRNNIMYNNAENNIDLKGTKYIVIEGNTLYQGIGDNDGGCKQSNYTPAGVFNDRFGGSGGITHGGSSLSEDIIIRNNIIYDNNVGLSLGTLGWMIYNNAIVNNSRDYTGSNSPYSDDRKPAFVSLLTHPGRQVLLNNIIGDSPYGEIRGNGDISSDFNLFYNTTKPVEFVEFRGNHDWDIVDFDRWKIATTGDNNSIIADPKFKNVVSKPIGDSSQYDFSLKASSAAIDAGGFLTTTINSGTGTQINVVDARFFYNGYGIVPGDLIQFDGQTETAIVTAVDYTANTLSIDTSLTWSANLGLSLAYSGTAPDMGAKEYSSTTNDLISPTMPTNLAATNTTQTSTDLNWDASTSNDVVGYNIYQDGLFVATTSSISLQMINLIPNTMYSFVVVARDADGNTSNDSNTEIVTTLMGDLCDDTDLLFAYYKFETSGGTTLIDESPNANNGTIFGAIPGVGVIDNGLTFDGIDDYVDLGNFNVTGSQLTISTWIKANSFNISDARIISKANGVNSDQHTWMLSTVDDGGDIKIRYRINTEGTNPNNAGTYQRTSTLLSTQTLEIDRWYHITATYNGTHMRLYIDGNDSGNVRTKRGLITPSNSEVRIGDNPTGNKNFDGIIDELRIYNKVLSVYEIFELMTCEASNTAANTTIERSSNINIYPNPTQNKKTNIQLNDSINLVQLSIYNIMGQLVYKKKTFNSNKNISLKFKLPNGTYLLRMITTTDKLIIKKLVID